MFDSKGSPQVYYPYNNINIPAHFSFFVLIEENRIYASAFLYNFHRDDVRIRFPKHFSTRSSPDWIRPDLRNFILTMHVTQTQRRYAQDEDDNYEDPLQNRH